MCVVCTHTVVKEVVSFWLDRPAERKQLVEIT